MSSDTGFGHYRLTRDSLILYYDTMEVEKLSHILIDTMPAGGDSCELQFYLHDNVGPLINSIVIVGTAKGRVIGKATDMDGRTVVKVPWDEFPVMVACRYIGYYPVRTTVDSAINQKLAVWMNPSMKHITPGGTVHAYGLRKIKRKKILLTWQNVDESGEMRIARWMLYRRNHPSKP